MGTDAIALLFRKIGGASSMRQSITLLTGLLWSVVGIGANPTAVRLPSPEMPVVQDITLSAYFLDVSPDKNKNLCEAVKRVLDRDQETRPKEEGKPSTSYRLCFSINEAIAEGYIKAAR